MSTTPTRTRTPDTLVTFTCPTCPASIATLPDVSQVGHRCPGKRNVWTDWKVDNA